MDTKTAIKNNIDTAAMVCGAYLDDLTDQELTQRPHPGCNHLKWQVGHLIASEHEMIEGVAPGTMPALPAGFAERYAREAALSDDPAKFDTKEVLMKVAAEQRAGTLASLAKQSDAGLDQPSPESMQGYAPNVGAVFNMIGGHWMMHAGQWVILRRQLDKPVVI